MPQLPDLPRNPFHPDQELPTSTAPNPTKTRFISRRLRSKPSPLTSHEHRKNLLPPLERHILNSLPSHPDRTNPLDRAIPAAHSSASADISWSICRCGSPAAAPPSGASTLTPAIAPRGAPPPGR